MYPSPVLKQLKHEAEHLPPFSAEVADQCSCNGASAECLRSVNRDNFTLYYCFVGITQISMWT